LNHRTRIREALRCLAFVSALLLSVPTSADEDVPAADEPFPADEDVFRDAPSPREEGTPETPAPADEVFRPPPPTAEGVPGWTPSLAIGADVQSGTFSGKVSSTLRGSFSGERDFVSANPVLRAELRTPVLADVPGQPRLFAHVGWQWGWYVIEDKRFVVEELKPGSVTFPTSPASPTDPPPDLFDGVGSEIDAEIRNGWYTGLGADLVTRLWELDFHFKPSLDYYQQDVKYTGLVRNGTCETTINMAMNLRCVKGTQQAQAINGSEGALLHAIGPRLGMEVDLARRGPFAFSMFVEGFVYWFVGDRAVRFEGQSGPDFATFSAESDAMLVGGSAGMRVSWRGD